MQPISNTNSFFGIRVSQPGIDVLTAGPNQLAYQSDYTTQTWYGINGNPTLNIGNIGTTDNPQYGMSVPTSNGVLTFGDNTDGSQGIQAVDSTGDVLFEMNGSTWYWYNNGYPTVLAGERPANGTNGLSQNEKGFFVSPPGTNVFDATDAQLIFNSNQNVFKIVATVTMNIPDLYVDSITGPGVIMNDSYTEIAHNLGYTPVFIGYRYFGPSPPTYESLPHISFYNLPAGNNVNSPAATFSRIDTYVDDTNIEVFTEIMTLCLTSYNVISISTGSQTLVFYLLQESL